MSFLWLTSFRYWFSPGEYCESSCRHHYRANTRCVSGKGSFESHKLVRDQLVRLGVYLPTFSRIKHRTLILIVSKCDQINPNWKGNIKEAYTDANRLVNIDGVKANIDWNSAAALEFLGPSGILVSR